MIINTFTLYEGTTKISIPDSCYERCENYIEEFKRYLSESNLYNTEDFNKAHIEAGKIRGKIHAYLLALYDLNIMPILDNEKLRRYYSDRITNLYELWIEDYDK